MDGVSLRHERARPSAGFGVERVSGLAADRRAHRCLSTRIGQQRTVALERSDLRDAPHRIFVRQLLAREQKPEYPETLFRE